MIVFKYKMAQNSMRFLTWIGQHCPVRRIPRPSSRAPRWLPRLPRLLPPPRELPRAIVLLRRCAWRIAMCKGSSKRWFVSISITLCETPPCRFLVELPLRLSRACLDKSPPCFIRKVRVSEQLRGVSHLGS
eukprot:COSAG06_NODE_1228_length_10179_cov_3.735119_18_plen_131_part_00